MLCYHISHKSIILNAKCMIKWNTSCSHKLLILESCLKISRASLIKLDHDFSHFLCCYFSNLALELKGTQRQPHGLTDLGHKYTYRCGTGIGWGLGDKGIYWNENKKTCTKGLASKRILQTKDSAQWLWTFFFSSNNKAVQMFFLKITVHMIKNQFTLYTPLFCINA